ncbi:MULTISPECIES: hypothetical protein [unclassified Nocardia]|uniref:hypothetical protein n=1 Tax=Nocardia sp. CC201C TaxID=3044575 RepID=UPI0024A9134E|nr:MULTISPECIES: hypothetical protein [unclassified Nocardia]
MTSGRSQIHRARLDPLPTAHQPDRQPGPAGENAGEQGGMARVEMLHQQHRHRQVGGQAADDMGQRGGAARG